MVDALDLLLVPPQGWRTVGLDYLTHLHVSNGIDCVLIVVDHPTRMSHFLVCLETITIEGIVSLLLHGVYILHGLSRVLVSEHDPKLVGDLWQTPWRHLGARLIVSSSRHVMELTEGVNNAFQQFMRCLCCYD
jgi:hypothetical protein